MAEQALDDILMQFIDSKETFHALSLLVYPGDPGGYEQ